MNQEQLENLIGEKLKPKIINPWMIMFFLWVFIVVLYSIYQNVITKAGPKVMNIDERITMTLHTTIGDLEFYPTKDAAQKLNVDNLGNVKTFQITNLNLNRKGY